MRAGSGQYMHRFCFKMFNIFLFTLKKSLLCDNLNKQYDVSYADKNLPRKRRFERKFLKQALVYYIFSGSLKLISFQRT